MLSEDLWLKHMLRKEETGGPYKQGGGKKGKEGGSHQLLEFSMRGAVCPPFPRTGSRWCEVFLIKKPNGICHYIA